MNSRTLRTIMLFVVSGLLALVAVPTAQARASKSRHHAAHKRICVKRHGRTVCRMKKVSDHSDSRRSHHR
ncbi:MAG TPA: hypothetical protein VGF74_15790, partial [Thermoleophilaceae bacterium]